MSHVKIQMTGRKQGKVWVDGEEVKNVVALSFEVDVRDPDSIAALHIHSTIYPTQTEIEGEMETTLLDNAGSRTFEVAEVKM